MDSQIRAGPYQPLVAHLQWASGCSDAHPSQPHRTWTGGSPSLNGLFMNGLLSHLRRQCRRLRRREQCSALSYASGGVGGG
jgi:hypothetical protein